MKKYVAIIFCAFLLIACGGKNTLPLPPEPPNDGYVAPDPPTTINSYNLFTVEFYSNLTDETLIGTKTYDALVSHINSERTTLYFFFDRIDMTQGQVLPLVNIAMKTKSVPFFAQNNIGSSFIEGTGIITRQLVNVYPGIYPNSNLFIAGCNVSVPLYQTNRLSLLTCKIKDKSQFNLLAERKIDGAEANQIVIGTIIAGLEEDFKAYLKTSLTDFRVSINSSTLEGKTYKLFILSPVSFVTRSVTETQIGNIPVFQCKIEYLE